MSINKIEPTRVYLFFSILIYYGNKKVQLLKLNKNERTVLYLLKFDCSTTKIKQRLKYFEHTILIIYLLKCASHLTQFTSSLFNNIVCTLRALGEQIS